LAAKNADMIERLGGKLKNKLKRAAAVLAEAESTIVELARQLHDAGVAVGRMALERLLEPNGLVATWRDAVEKRAETVRGVEDF
jgi:hypothetical protein